MTQGKADREGEKRSFIHWFIPQTASRAKFGPGQSQESGTLFRSPIWLAGSKHSGHVPLPYHAHYREQGQKQSSPDPNGNSDM